MFSKFTTADNRLWTWRNIRNQQYNGPVSVAKQFDDIKITQRYLDYHTPSTWPSVFELVSNGIFCPTGVTLVLAATLHHLDFIKTETIKLPVISNTIDGTTGAVLEIDGVIYNFLQGKVVDVEYMQDNSTMYKTHLLDPKELFR